MFSLENASCLATLGGFMAMGMITRVLGLGLVLNWAKIVLVVICTIVAAVLPISLPLVLGRVIDMAVKGGGLTDLLPLLIFLVVLAIASALAGVVASSQGARVGYELSWQLAKKLYYHLLRMPLLSYFIINPGVMSSRLTNDMRLVDPLFVTIPLSVIHGWAGLAAVAIGLAYINAWFLAAFALVPLTLVAVRFAERKINSTVRESYEVNATTALHIESTTNADAINLVRQAGRTVIEERKFAELAARSVHIAARTDTWRAMIVISYSLCFDLITVLFLGIGVVLAASNQVSIGSVVSALFFVGLVRQPLGEVVGQRYPLIRASMGLERVEEVLKSPNTGLSTVAATPRSSQKTKIEAELVFDNVEYIYPSRKEIEVKSLSDVAAANAGTTGFLSSVTFTQLIEAEVHEQDEVTQKVINNLSFSVSRGETVAIAGHSGSGKSTILNLACGSLRPTSGTVRIGGIDTGLLTEEDVWQSVSLVSQDIYLRDASLRDNLAYGLENATDMQLIEALNQAGLDDLLARLPDGLNTNVGQRGKRFSGGERQRIAIARAVLRDRPLLILDEATSHLDMKREEGILDAVAAIAKEKAVLVVAHRLSALERADIILMLDKGRIVEKGTHAELFGAGGPYAKMHRTKRPTKH
jgi:ATP-binding cassette subfamily B protein